MIIKRKIKNWLLHWAFVLIAVVIISAMSMWFCYHWWSATPIVCFCDGLCMILPWLIIPPRYRGWWLVFPLVYCLSIVANLCFGFFFLGLIPAELFLSTTWMNTYVLGRGISVFQPALLIPVIEYILLVISWIVLRKHYPAYNLKGCTKSVAAILCIICFLHIIQIARVHHHQPELTLKECIADEFECHSSYKADILRHGYILAYTMHYFESRVIPHPLSPKDIKAVEQLEHENKGQLPQEYAEAFKANRGKNLICIVVESLDSDVLNRVVAGVRVVPTLDSLASDSTVITLEPMKQRIGIGKSSDGQLMAFGGLIQCEDCPIVYINNYASYPSIFHALHYDECFAVIGEHKMIWNAENYLTSLGLTSIYDNITEFYIKDGDKLVFDKAFDVIKSCDEPFCTMIGTVQMHEPYFAENADATAIRKSGQIEPSLAYYYEITRETDKRLGQFLEQLKKSGIYQRSVIAIVADHNSYLHFNTSIPGFILNSGIPHKFIADRQLTQLDFYPTLLDVMGLGDSGYWPGMGLSALRPGLEPLSATQLKERSELCKRLLRADYFNNSKE